MIGCFVVRKGIIVRFGPLLDFMCLFAFDIEDLL